MIVPHLVDQRAQLDRPVGELEVLELAPHVAVPEREHRARGLVDPGHAILVVHDDLSGRGMLERDLAEIRGPFTLGGSIAADPRHSEVRVGGSVLHEHTPLQVVRNEEVASTL